MKYTELYTTTYKPKEHLKLLLFFKILFVLLLLSTSYVFAQTSLPVEVSGTLKSATGDILPGVTVKIEGANSGTVTNVDGKFKITVPNQNAVLSFSFIGFHTEKVSVGSQTTLEITLKEDIKSLDDVVVIGYQEVTRKKATAAISTVRARDIANIPSPNITSMLQGLVPGLNVQNFSGEPGARNTFMIRGNTALSRDPSSFANSNPLFVIDGVPMDPSDMDRTMTIGTNNYLAGLNPSDVETIDILKDASAAAIYGSRGANGVIIITTKKGKAGKPRVSFNTYMGISESPALPKILTGMAERRAKMDFFKTGDYWERSNNPIILTDSLNPAFNNSNNWYDLFYRTGIKQNYDLSISGGSENSTYRLGLGYYDETGIVTGTGLTRYSFNLNLSNKITKSIESATNIRYSQTKRKPSPGGGLQAIPYDYTKFPSSLLYLSAQDKAYYDGNYNNSRTDNSDNKLTMTEVITAHLKDWITFRSNNSVTFNSSRQDLFSPSTASGVGKAVAVNNANSDKSFLTEDYLDVNKKFGNHGFKLLGGITFQGNEFYTSNITGNYIPNDNITVISGVTKDNLSANTTYEVNGMLSYISRFTYDFKEKYILDFTWRGDYSSKFGSDNRWGYFPSAAVNWIVTEEGFMQKIKPVVNYLKLRATYGLTGNQGPMSNYGRYNRYEINGNFGGAYNNPTSYNGVTSILPRFSDGVAQDKLSWEKTSMWNLGFDAGLFNDRIYIQFDAYNKITRGILLDFTMPVTSGYQSYYTNAADVQNSGFDFLFKTRNLSATSKLQWTTTITASFVKNLLLKLPDGGKTIINGNRILEQGLPMYPHYVLKYLGPYSSKSDLLVNPFTGQAAAGQWGTPWVEGDARYADYNGNYHLDIWDASNDLTPVGDPNPKWTGGFVNEFAYKNWSLRILCSFTLKRDILNVALANTLEKFSNPGGADELGNGYSQGYNTGQDWYYPEDYIARRAWIDLNKLDFWKKSGDQSKFPRLTPYVLNYNYWAQSSMFMEDGSYFKVNNIVLAYNFQQPFFKKIGIESLKLWGAVDNVLLIKNKNTLTPNPEAVDSYGEYTGVGYAIPKNYTIGLELNF